MAHSQEVWQEARFLWELDKPLSYIEEKTKISRGQISKKANKEQWEKETKGNELKPLIKEYDKEKETLEKKGNDIVSKLCTMEDYEITLLDKVIQDETGNKSLLFSTANLSLIRKNQLLTKNKKEVIAMETIYSDEGKPLKKTPITIETELSPADLKTIDEGVDKNAVTLEVAPRHSNQQINVQTNTQVNNNNIEVEWE